MPIPRLQNCYKPPKKFGWRSDSVAYNPVENSLDKSHISSIVSPEDKSDKMRPTLENGTKPSEEPEPTPLVEDIKPIIHSSSEEIPLDFSLKTKTKCYPKANESEDDLVKQPQHSSPSVAFPGMVNGNHRKIPSPYNNLVYPKYVRSSNDRNSPDADWSQSSNDSSPRMENGFDGKVLKPSPEYPSVCSSDGSPNRQTSLLQELLTTQQHQKSDAECSIRSSPPFSHTNGSHGISGIPLFNGTSPAMMPTGSNYPFYKFMPQASPAFPFAYTNPRPQLMPNYLPQFAESAFVESSVGRKQNKRKLDFIHDPFKSCSVDDLQNNLRSIEIVNPYMASIRPVSELISPGRLSTDQVSTLSPNRSSPESVRSAISHSATNGSNHSATNCTSPPTATNGNHSAIQDNHCVINGMGNISQASSSNDSISSAIAESDKTESFSDGRKRKTIPDSEKNEAYYARRSKNNEAARKSRETRRKKEELVKATCIALDSSNKALKHEVGLLMLSLEQVQRQNYTLTAENDSLKIQNTLLVEKLKQKKCGQCGSTLPNVN